MIILKKMTEQELATDSMASQLTTLIKDISDLTAYKNTDWTIYHYYMGKLRLERTSLLENATENIYLEIKRSDDNCFTGIVQGRVIDFYTEGNLQAE